MKRSKDKLDERYVTSACCTWHGPIHEVGGTPPQKVIVNGREIENGGLPCCPHCGSVLYQDQNRSSFDAGAERFMRENMNGDKDYLRWLQSLHDSGTCKPLKDWDWRADFAAWKELNHDPIPNP